MTLFEERAKTPGSLKSVSQPWLDTSAQDRSNRKAACSIISQRRSLCRHEQVLGLLSGDQVREPERLGTPRALQGDDATPTEVRPGVHPSVCKPRVGRIQKALRLPLPRSALTR